MKLIKIKINNFRGKNFDFSPGPINFFFSPNGYGKTSLCDAIRYGITGLTPKDDVRETSVSITFEKGTNSLTVERIRGKTTICRVNTKRATERATDDAIADLIGVSLDDVKIASSSDVFMSTRPEEFLQLLIQYIPEELNFNTVMGYFSNLTDEIREDCGIFFPPMPQQFGIKEIGEAYDFFFNQRKQLKAIQANRRELLASLEPIPPERTLQEIENDLTNIMLYVKNRSLACNQRLEYNAAVKKRKAQEQRISVLQKQIGNATVKQPSEYQLRQIEQRKNAAEKERINRSCELTTIKNNIALLSKTLTGLSTPTCPISEKLYCTTDKTAIREEMTMVLEENKKLQVSIEAILSEQNNIVNACIAEEKKYRSQKSAYDLYIRNTAELKAYMDNLLPLPPEPPVLAENAQQIEARKRQLNSERKNIEDYTKQQNIMQEVTGINHKIEVCNIVLSELKDNGNVKTSIIDYYLSIFERVCNSRAAQFAPEYEIKLKAEDGVKIYTKTPVNDNFYPIQGLSSGEKTITIFLMLDMLNQLSNSRLLFIDNVEALDNDALINLATLIEKPEFQAAYDHIFICGVNHTEVLNAFRRLSQ